MGGTRGLFLVGCRDPGCAVPGGREDDEAFGGGGGGRAGGRASERAPNARQRQRQARGRMRCSRCRCSSKRQPGQRALAEFKAVAHSGGYGPALTFCPPAGVRAADWHRALIVLGRGFVRGAARQISVRSALATRAKSQGPRAKGQEPRAKSPEPRAQSPEQSRAEPRPARPDGRRPSAALCSGCWAAGEADLRYGAVFYDVLTMALHGAPYTTMYVWTRIGGGRWRAVAACRCQH